MNNTAFFVQCKNCENCSLSSVGYICEENLHTIDNPNVDGCTWGMEKEDGGNEDEQP